MYNKDDNPTAQVGQLHAGKFYCWACIDYVHTDGDGHPAYTIRLHHIIPHSQSCAYCGTQIVQGEEIHGELYAKKHND